MRDRPGEPEPSHDELPVIGGDGPLAARMDAAAGYLEGRAERLTVLGAELRLAGAEAALSDPRPPRRPGWSPPASDAEWP